MDSPIPPPSANALPAHSATAAKDVQPGGLSSEEARRRLEKVGPNAMPDTALHPLRGALVRRGEAVAEVTATGTRTKFGRTAELVRTAYVVSSQQKAVLRVEVIMPPQSIVSIKLAL
jgi:hypothetical protein